MITGEGCFIVNIIKSSSLKIGERVMLSFRIYQHTRDKVLMESIQAYLDCGKYYSRGKAGVFELTGFQAIEKKIIPFFKKYSIQGEKSKDFQDFCKVADLIKTNDHLTLKGLNQIKKIKSGMNRGRDQG